MFLQSLLLLFALSPVWGKHELKTLSMVSSTASVGSLKSATAIMESHNRGSYNLQFTVPVRWNIEYNQNSSKLSLTLLNIRREQFREQIRVLEPLIQKVVLSHSRAQMYRLELYLKDGVMPAPFASKGQDVELNLSFIQTLPEEPLPLHQTLKAETLPTTKLSRRHQTEMPEAPISLNQEYFHAYRSTEIEPGLSAFKFRIANNSAVGYGFRLSPALLKSRLMIASAGQQGNGLGLNTLSAIAREQNALLAINGSYFLANGDPLGLVIQNQRLISSPLMERACFGILPDGTAHVGHATYHAKVRFEGGSLDIEGINQETSPFAASLYTKEFGIMSPARQDTTHILIRDGVVQTVSNQPINIPENGSVLLVPSRSNPLLKGLSRGKQVDLRIELSSPWDRMVWAIGGGPRLLKSSQINSSMESEGFNPQFLNSEAPRSGLAVDRQGNLVMVVIDGRQENSRGLTVLEFANCLKALGGVDAINLDGGGSSALYFDGVVINQPSDGQERKIANALILQSDRNP